MFQFLTRYSKTDIDRGAYCREDSFNSSLGILKRRFYNSNDLLGDEFQFLTRYSKTLKAILKQNLIIVVSIPH